jgi:glycosyltransferase involved in cell wall biosynthesis
MRERCICVSLSYFVYIIWLKMAHFAVSTRLLRPGRLEAMQGETAIITSDVSAMPEVAGEAALLVNPYEVSQIAQAMHTLWQSPQQRSDLVTKGRIQREKFSL